MAFLSMDFLIPYYFTGQEGPYLTLVEVEGAHIMQEAYESIDTHVGQSIAFLVTLHVMPKDYYIVASTCFTKPILTATAILHFEGSKTHIYWSMKQARSKRWNLTANAARPNPQGSFLYGTINAVRTFVLANSAMTINGKLRYAVTRVSYVNPSTPLKIADFKNIPRVFNLKTIRDKPTPGPIFIGTSVINIT